VSCNFPSTTVHGYLDGELDAVRAGEFERHLEECPECMAALDAQEALRSALQRGNLYEKAPAGLMSKVVAAQRAVAPVTAMSPRRVFAQWLAIAAALILVAYSCWRIIPTVTGKMGQNDLAAQVVDAHLRSLEPGHLTDVVSTDQHTVKPWFDGKIDFAPPVQDFSADGFPLAGGRLDVVGGRTVAALVYGRRKHLVNVFIWPTREEDTYPKSSVLQGYHWMTWRKNGMVYWAVSDASEADLGELQHLLSR
jgi:anti-sigma factor (TIGR02949 family)